MLTIKQKITLISVILFISFVYFISSAYITCSNDGSHFALVSAIVNDHSLKIDNYLHYTKMVDYAIRDGHHYSDRVPGTALMTIPFYYFGKIIKDNKLNHLISEYPNIEEITVILLPNLSASIGVLLLFLLFKHFGFTFQTCLISSTIFAFGTLNWLEATHLFSHATSMVTFLASLYYLLKINTIEDNKTDFYLMILFLSLSSIIEIQNILFSFFFFYYLIRTRKILLSVKSIFTTNRQTFFIGMVIFVFVYSLLIIYNYNAFGIITIKSNQFNPRFPEEVSFFSSLSGGLFRGLDELFTSFKNIKTYIFWGEGIRNRIPGLLVVSPVLIFSVIGFKSFFIKYKNEAILFLLLIITNVLIAALHKTTLTRHVFTILPIFFFPIIFIIDNIHRSIKENGFHNNISILLIFSFLFTISILRIFYSIHTYYDRSLLYLFPFINELKVYFLFLVLFSMIVLFFFILRNLFKIITILFCFKYKYFLKRTQSK